MKPRLLELIVCPDCCGNLVCEPSRQDGDDILSGVLRCQRCACQFPIVKGIPRLLPASIAPDKQRTAEAFGWEWLEFQELHDEATYREQFLDWIWPVTGAEFRDKVVLDAGCGMGRFTVVAAQFGARDVLAVDLSDAVEPAARNAHGWPNVHVIQADIYHLPFPKRPSGAPVIDVAYSIGVLHHLPQPELGFRAITEHLKADGAMIGWVYGQENNEWITRFVNPVREAVSSRLPRRVLYGLSLAITSLLQPLLVALYRPGSPGLPPNVQARLPYASYLSWLAKYGFRHNHHVVFDHLVAPTAFYIPRSDYEGWFQRAKFAEITISARNGNSWRGLGRGLGD